MKEEKLVLTLSLYSKLYDMSDKCYQSKERKACLYVCVCSCHEPTSSVSVHWSCDSEAISIIKLIIQTKYEGKHPPFDAHSKERKRFQV